MFRVADIPDVKHIVELGFELLENSVYNGIKPDVNKFKFLLASMMNSNKGIVYVIVDKDDIPQGFLVGIIEELFFSRMRYGTDICFYVRKEYRKYAPGIVKGFIKWAKSKPRVDHVLLGVSSGSDNIDRVCDMYQKLGMEKVGGLFYSKNERGLI